MNGPISAMWRTFCFGDGLWRRGLVRSRIMGGAILALSFSSASASAQGIDFELFETRQVLSIFDNRGIIGQDPRTSAGLGFFPANTPNNYVFGTGLWVGGVRNGQKVVSTAYDASGGFSEFNAGRAPSNGGGGDEILCSDQPEERARWYPEFSDPRTGRPIIVSQRDCVVIYNDSNQARDVTTPIGLEVRQRTMQFDVGLLAQVMFVEWEIVNAGLDALEDAFVGLNADMDVGDDFMDDRCSAVPLVPPGRNNPTATRINTDLGFCWDNDFFEPSFNPNPPGFVGFTLLRGATGAGGRPLGLTRFTLTTNPDSERPQPDPQTDAEQYDLLGGIGARAPFIDNVPADVRFVAISGPFDLAPGEAQRVLGAYVWANVSNGRTTLPVSESRCFPQGVPCYLPDPNDPALQELIQVQRTARLTADAGFSLCGGAAPTLVGSAAADLLVGTPGPDVIDGLDGNDRIEGRGGNDVLCGELGFDILIGGDGDDRLNGQAGNDALDGGAGRDLLLGDNGEDLLEGGEGDDALWGGDGNDRLYGRRGNDVLEGELGADLLEGGGGNDDLNGRGGTDDLRGGDGDDRMDGGDAFDRCDGGTHVVGDTALKCESATGIP